MTTTGRFLCPETPAHGKLIDADRGWYCPHRDHDGYRGTAPTRAYFSATEAETGDLAPISRSAPDLPAPNASRRKPVRAQIPIPEQMT